MSELMDQFSELSVSTLIPSLPNDVAIDIVARVPRSHYPNLSLVSKNLRKLIASPTLYQKRSQLGITQHRLYAFLRNRNTGDFSFYILHRKLNSSSNRLVVVWSPRPLMSPHVSFVPVGSKLYVFHDLSALSFDCTSHTVQPISDIPQVMSYKEANVVGKKIYVIGHSIFNAVKMVGEFEKISVSVFDIETQLWEPKLVKEGNLCVIWSDSVVMDGKIYLKSDHNLTSFVYEPEKRKWGMMDEMMTSKEWEGACVVDDVLYYLDLSEKVLRAYDPKLSCWSVVNGLEGFLAVETARSWGSKTVNYGDKKLALFFPKKHEGKEVICCAEIALERRQGGDIWGKMESCDVVIEDGPFDMMKCVSATV